VVLLTRPFIGESPNELWWKNFAPAYNAATVEVAKSNGVLVVDTYAYCKGKKEYFSDESHFNERGHRATASIIYENIKALLAHLEDDENRLAEEGSR
jgi:lysophospholipase L1-like esterase